MSLFGNLKAVDQENRNESGPKIAEAAHYTHSILGPGLDEEIYKQCLAEELKYMRVAFKENVIFPVTFRGKKIRQGFNVDFVVENRALVFVIAEEKHDVHKAQIRSLLKLSGLEEAYLVNFRVADMREGIMRAVVKEGRLTNDIRLAKKVN